MTASRRMPRSWRWKEVPVSRIPPFGRALINVRVKLIESTRRNSPFGQPLGQSHRVLQWELQVAECLPESRIHCERMHPEVMPIARIVGGPLGKIGEVCRWMIASVIGCVQAICLAGPVACPWRSVQNLIAVTVARVVDEGPGCSGLDVVVVGGADGDVVDGGGGAGGDVTDGGVGAVGLGEVQGHCEVAVEWV